MGVLGFEFGDFLGWEADVVGDKDFDEAEAALAILHVGDGDGALPDEVGEGVLVEGAELVEELEYPVIFTGWLGVGVNDEGEDVGGPHGFATETAGEDVVGVLVLDPGAGLGDVKAGELLVFEAGLDVGFVGSFAEGFELEHGDGAVFVFDGALDAAGDGFLIGFAMPVEAEVAGNPFRDGFLDELLPAAAIGGGGDGGGDDGDAGGVHLPRVLDEGVETADGLGRVTRAGHAEVAGAIGIVGMNRPADFVLLWVGARGPVAVGVGWHFCFALCRNIGKGANTSMNTLTLDPTDEAVAGAVADCKVGDEKTLLVTGKVTAVGDMVTLDVTGAEYAEHEAEEEVEEMPMPEKGMKKGKGNPALVLLIGKK